VYLLCLLSVICEMLYALPVRPSLLSLLVTLLLLCFLVMHLNPFVYIVESWNRGTMDIVIEVGF
jgi:uncharacterized membrane protein YccC